MCWKQCALRDGGSGAVSVLQGSPRSQPETSGHLHSHLPQRPIRRKSTSRVVLPDCAHFIVSLKNPRSPQVRAFRIVGDVVEELAIIGVD